MSSFLTAWIPFGKRYDLTDSCNYFIALLRSLMMAITPFLLLLWRKIMFWEVIHSTKITILTYIHNLPENFSLMACNSNPQYFFFRAFPSQNLFCMRKLWQLYVVGWNTSRVIYYANLCTQSIPVTFSLQNRKLNGVQFLCRKWSEWQANMPLSIYHDIFAFFRDKNDWIDTLPSGVGNVLVLKCYLWKAQLKNIHKRLHYSQFYLTQHVRNILTFLMSDVSP